MSEEERRFHWFDDGRYLLDDGKEHVGDFIRTTAMVSEQQQPENLFLIGSNVFQVELKGPGYTSNYNNVMIIIPAIIIVTLMSEFIQPTEERKRDDCPLGYLGYRLVDSLRSKKRSKEEKARLKQQKKAERQTSPQPASPGKNKQK